MSNREPVGWITVHGKHVPLFEGESKSDAISRAFDSKSFANSEKSEKEKQISKNEMDAKELNKSDSQSGMQSHKEFNKSITDARESRPEQDRWRVDVHSADEYAEKGCRCWKSNGGSTVAVTKSGDIISVCKKMGDDSVRGKDLLSKAVEMGGTKLDSFAGNHAFYTANGFEPVSWTPFNEQYAPNGWKESGCGQEPVVFYKYVGVGKVKYTDFEQFKNAVSPFTGDDGYDKAYMYRDSKIKGGR